MLFLWREVRCFRMFIIEVILGIRFFLGIVGDLGKGFVEEV